MNTTKIVIFALMRLSFINSTDVFQMTDNVNGYFARNIKNDIVILKEIKAIKKKYEEKAKKENEENDDEKNKI